MLTKIDANHLVGLLKASFSVIFRLLESSIPAMLSQLDVGSHFHIQWLTKHAFKSFEHIAVLSHIQMIGHIRTELDNGGTRLPREGQINSTTAPNSLQASKAETLSVTVHDCTPLLIQAKVRNTTICYSSSN